MSTWALWCIDNHLKYRIYLVLILLLPIYLIAGMFCGLRAMYNEWKSITKAIKHRGKR